MKNILYSLAIIVLFFSCNKKSTQEESTEEITEDATSGATKKSEIHYIQETHFKNIRQLTNGGDIAEAYWSFDDSKLVFQATYDGWKVACDQIFVAGINDDIINSTPSMVSTGLGRTTCSYFLPGDTTVVYASTHLVDEACPAKPAKRADGKYVWPVYESFDIFTTDLKGNIQKQLTNTKGYDAEATVSPKGDRMVFTSMRSGDLELYTMNIDGSDVVQITDELGYDGGAFYSPDGSKLIFRASRPKSAEDVKIYKDLLAEGLVMPTDMELFVCNSDGSELKQITNLGGANWAPFFHPSGKKIIFSSNHASERGFPFNLYMIDLDGNNLEQISYDGVFDSFPVFSNDGKYLVFSSNRNNGGTRDTNLFLAEWVD